MSPHSDWSNIKNGLSLASSSEEISRSISITFSATKQSPDLSSALCLSSLKVKVTPGATHPQASSHFLVETLQRHSASSKGQPLIQTNANLNPGKGRFRTGGRRKASVVLGATMNGAI